MSCVAGCCCMGCPGIDPVVLWVGNLPSVSDKNLCLLRRCLFGSFVAKGLVATAKESFERFTSARLSFKSSCMDVDYMINWFSLSIALHGSALFMHANIVGVSSRGTFPSRVSLEHSILGITTLPRVQIPGNPPKNRVDKV